MRELLFDHLLYAVHGDLEGADLRRLPNLRDVFHVPHVEGRADVDHRPLAFVRADVRGCIKDLQAVQVPPERAHVRLDLDRRLIEGDEKAGLLLGESLEEEIEGKNCLAAPGRTQVYVWARGHLAAGEHVLETHHTRR